jgi:hypothetical protein
LEVVCVEVGTGAGEEEGGAERVENCAVLGGQREGRNVEGLQQG